VTLLALALQAATAGPLLERQRPTAPAPRCGTAGPDGEVVVCAAPQEAFRLRPLPDRYDADAPALPRAETKIGNATLAAEGEQAGVGGFVSNRAMMRLKVPF
jgi:hypothetical protein